MAQQKLIDKWAKLCSRRVQTLDVEALLFLYSSLIEELIKRNVIKTTNNPVADYGEYVAAKNLKLELVKNSQKGYDAVDLEDVRR